MSLEKIPVPTIGEILREEFLEPMGIIAYRLAKEINVSTTTILELLNNNRKITVDTALRFARYFGNTERFWLNLQNDIDIRNKKTALQSEIEKIKPYSQGAV
jgi:addiction module HigA family antidote